MKKKILLVSKPMLTLILIWILFRYFVPTERFLAVLREASSTWIAVLVLCQLMRRLLAAVQVTILLNRMKSSANFWNVLKAQNLGIFYSFFAPGELGISVVTYFFLARETEKKSVALSCLTYVRILRYATLVCFAGLGIWLEPKLISMNVHLYVCLLAILILGGLVFFHSDRVLSTGRRISGGVILILGSRPLMRIHKKLWDAFEGARNLSLATLLGVGACVLLAQLFAVAGFYAAQFSLGIELPWSVALWLSATITILSSLPITFSGIGVREIGVAALLLHLYNTPSEESVALSLVVYGSYIIVSTLLGGILGLVVKTRPAPESAVN